MTTRKTTILSSTYNPFNEKEARDAMDKLGDGIDRFLKKHIDANITWLQSSGGSQFENSRFTTLTAIITHIESDQ